MELLFTDRRRAIAAGVVPGGGPAEVTALFERRVALDGTPVLLDEAMRPVEPLSSWFRHLAVMGRSPEAMHKYAYFNDPMREVDEAFRARTTHDELTYAEIGHQLLTRAERDGDAPQG